MQVHQHWWINTRTCTQMAEISRVLRPGGVFVGTTFMGALAPLGEVLGEDVVRPVARVCVLWMMRMCDVYTHMYICYKMSCVLVSTK